MSIAVTLRNLETKDLLAVAQIHESAFPHSAITHLGTEAVCRYYDWQLSGPHEVVALGAFDDEKVLGFCFGGLFRGALSGYLRANGVFLGMRLLAHPWCLASPLFRARLKTGTQILIRLLRAPRPQAIQEEMTENGIRKESFGILALATHPASQGLGVGKILMQEIEQIAYQRGFRKMHLTVSTENLHAIRFYEQLHWQKSDAEGLWTGQMSKPLKI